MFPPYFLHTLSEKEKEIFKKIEGMKAMKSTNVKRLILSSSLLATTLFFVGCSSTESDDNQSQTPTNAQSQSQMQDQGQNQMPPPPQNDGEENDGTITKDQAQFWTVNLDLVSTEGSVSNQVNSAFGVNEATGHIKAYPSDQEGPMAKHVRAVSGTLYGTTYAFTIGDNTTLKKNQYIQATASDTYIDNGDGTITDTSTGLMWMKKDAGNAMTWEEALSYCEDSTYAGYTDWHLPDVKELQSIVDYTGVYPAINSTYFDLGTYAENPDNYFWTSTSAYMNPRDPVYAYAWYVAFGYSVGGDGKDTHGAGAVRFSPKYAGSPNAGEGGDNTANSVRAVRIDERYYSQAPSKVVTTGQDQCYDSDGNVITPQPGDAFYGQDANYDDGLAFSFTDNKDGTVTDNNTGLIWQVLPSNEHMSIDTAASYAEGLTLGGRSDYRLPTTEELFSIQDFSKGWPYCDETYFQFPAASSFVPPQGTGPQGGPQSGPQGGGPQG